MGEMLKYAASWAEVELAYLTYLGELHGKLNPGRHKLGFRWPTSAIPEIPFDFGVMDAPAAQNPRYQIGKIVEELNKSLVRMVDLLLQQRKERLLLAARILADLEQEPTL